VKKRWVSVILATMLVFAAVPALAGPIYTWEIDKYLGWTDQIKPPDEESWLESLIGKDVSYIDKIEYQKPQPNYLNGLFPGYTTWTYAIVKYSGNYAAFQDINGAEGRDFRLTIPGYGDIPETADGVFLHEISHVTFFGTSVAVPEPGTILLLGLGLLGIGIANRRKS
jgi:hypothetical protein